MNITCSKRVLNLTSLAFGLAATGALSLAVTTDYWIFTSEPVVVTVTSESGTTFSELPESEFGSEIVKTNLGLWRACVDQTELVEEGMPPTECEVIGYQGQSYERRDRASITSSIMRAIRRATPIIVASLIILVIAVAFSTVGNAKGDVKTFVGAVLYIVAALSLAVGVIIYISKVNDEVSHRKSPQSVDEEGFRYRYGWAFFFAGASFMCSMAAAVVNISLYLRRYSNIEDMVLIIPGLEKRGAFAFSRCVTEEEIGSTDAGSSRGNSRRNSVRLPKTFSGLPQSPTIIL